MAKIYLVRHRDAGILTQFAFTSSPADAQLEPIQKDLDRRFGGRLDKEGKPAWLRIHEMELLSDEVPVIETEEAKAAPVLPFTVSGTGSVS